MIKLKRIYEKPDKNDGYRVLVDRLWPRGVSKEKAALDLWLKEIAPSHELRKWYGHDPEKWPEFQNRYKAEILTNPEPLNKLREITNREETVTLLYASKDEKFNEAKVLLNILGE